MTETELMKSLEHRMPFDKVCVEAFDLINRKNAEIERLQSILLCFMDEVEKWENKHCLDVSELPLIPIKGETEKIKKQIKAEAIKEFAERLENKLANNTDISAVGYQSVIGEIINLVKEMAGDAE